MGNLGKHAVKYSVCMGVHYRIISVKFKFSNIRELKTHDIRKKIYPSNMRNAAVLESVQLIFVFHAFVCKFSVDLIDKCMENRTCFT